MLLLFMFLKKSKMKEKYILYLPSVYRCRLRAIQADRKVVSQSYADRVKSLPHKAYSNAIIIIVIIIM